MSLAFEVLPVRATFVAQEALRFPSEMPANLLRGALGAALRKKACVPECRDPRTCPARQTCPYACIFEPRTSGGGPSGYADRPRPFVLRAHHLAGHHVSLGDAFAFDVHLFDVREFLVAPLLESLALAAREGLGSGRKRAVLVQAQVLDKDRKPARQLSDGERLLVPNPQPVVLDLHVSPERVRRIVVRFLTPTELKGAESPGQPPEFAVLLARARDRIGALHSLYGAGPLDVGWKALGENAASIRRTRADIRHVSATRRSSRTGQVHPLGGFVGEIEYEGDLSEFLPYLRAAYWTGVGRQTVWGKGVIDTVVRGEDAFSPSQCSAAEPAVSIWG